MKPEHYIEQAFGNKFNKLKKEKYADKVRLGVLKAGEYLNIHDLKPESLLKEVFPFITKKKFRFLNMESGRSIKIKIAGTKNSVAYVNRGVGRAFLVTGSSFYYYWVKVRTDSSVNHKSKILVAKAKNYAGLKKSMKKQILALAKTIHKQGSIDMIASPRLFLNHFEQQSKEHQNKIIKSIVKSLVTLSKHKS